MIGISKAGTRLRISFPTIQNSWSGLVLGVEGESLDGSFSSQKWEMNYRIKTREKAPLLVKEIILPDKEKTPNFTSAQTHSDRNFSRPIETKKSTSECKKNTVNSCLKIGEHEVRSIAELFELKKEPEEMYFEGTKKKKKTKKRKIQSKNHVQSLSDFSCESGEGTESAREGHPKSRESLTKEEKIQAKKLYLEICKYNETREHTERNNSRRQKQAEENYIEQQENLAETWVEFLKRRKQLAEPDASDRFSHSKPLCREFYFNYNRIGISIVSRKFWNDGKDKPSSKKEEKSEERGDRENILKSNPSILDDLEEGFAKNLVFVDDSESESG